MEGVAFPATLRINYTIWERNAPDEVSVLQGRAAETAQKHGCISVNV